MAGYAIVIASIVFVVRYLQINMDDFLSALSGIDAGRVAVATLCFVVVLAVNASAFAAIARAASIPVARRELWGAWLAALPAKYVPIGVGHVAGRGVVLAMRGASWRSIIATGIFEQGVSLLWCLLIAWAFFVGGSFLVWSAVVPVVTAMVCLVAGLAFRRCGWPPNNVALALGAFLYAFAMLPYAIGYLVLVAPIDVGGFVSALFAGTIAGVVAIIAPGGLGVREGVAAAASTAGSGSATIMAGLFVARLVILLTEIAGSVAGAMMLGGRRSGGDR